MAKKTFKIEVVGDIRDAERDMDRLGVTVEETGGRFDGLADKVAGAFAAREVLAAGVDIVGQINEMGLAAEITGQKAATVFGPALADMQGWADELNESLGVTDTQLLGMSAAMADLLKPMGFTADQAAGMSKEMLDLSGALSAWSGGERSAAEVSEILSSAMLGEREALKSLGISINQTEVDQRALAIARAEGREEITQMDQALATQQLILEKSTDAQTAWADGSMSAVRSQNELKATVAELREGIAQALFPAIQGVTQFLVSDFIPAAQSVGRFVMENKEAFIAGALAVTSMLIPAFVGWAASAGAAALATAAAAAPVIAVGAAVAALTAGIIWAYENVDWFRDSVDAVAEFFRTDFLPILGTVKDTLITSFEVAWAVVEPIISSITQQIGGIITSAQGMIDFVKGVLTGDWSLAWDGIKQVFTGIWDTITAPIDNFPGILRDMPGKIASAAAGMFDGIWEAFRGAINSMIDGWNNLSFTFPSFSGDWNGPLPGGGFTVGGWTVSTPNIRRLHSGGVFQAPDGNEGLGIIKHGERLNPAPQFGRFQPDGVGDITLELHMSDEVITRKVERTALRRRVRINVA